MVPVSKYVDVSHPDMKGKTDFELWELLNHDAKMIVVTEYMGDRLQEAMGGLADRIVEGLRNAGASGKVARAEDKQQVAGGDKAATPSAPKVSAPTPA